MKLTNNVPEMKIRSKEYKKYILDAIDEFNSNGKKTVLVVCDNFFPVIDGVVNTVDNYARILSKDMNVMLLVPSYKGTIGVYSYPVIGVTSGFSQKLNNQVALPMFDPRYKKYLKKLRIDIIHCHSPFLMSRIAMRLHKKRNIPMVTTFHSLYKYDFEANAKPLVNFLLRFIAKCYNASDEVWTMNTQCVDILKEYGYNGKTYVLPHGVSTLPSTCYEQERSNMRQKLGVKDDELLFIFVGRLVAAKNVHFTVDVLANLKQRGLKFKMLFVGDGHEKSTLTKQIDALDLADEVTLIGQINSKDELTHIYAAADMLLFPSYYDTFALVKVEAASRYTPAAFIENCPAGSNVANNVNGYIFPQDVTAYADGIYNAVQDRESLEQVGKNAFRDLYKTWDEIVAKVAIRYNEVIDEHNK